MKMTKKNVEKVARENGIDLTGISVRKIYGAWEIEMETTAEIERLNREYAAKTGLRRDAPEVKKLIAAYNRVSRKLVKVLAATTGVHFHGRFPMGGPATWYEGEPSTSEKLALANID